MKRKWLYVGILFGVLLQMIVNALWSQTIQYTVMQLFSRIAAALSFAILVGFFYLHVPEAKRRLQSGLTIGSIIGLLLGLYQFFDAAGSLNSFANLNALQIIKTIILGAVCGGAISYSELTLNPNRK